MIQMSTILLNVACTFLILMMIDDSTIFSSAMALKMNHGLDNLTPI